MRRVWHVSAVRGPPRVPRGVLRVAVGRDPRGSLRGAGARRRRPRRRVLRHVMWFTLWQAVVSTVLTLAVGLPAAYVVARYEFPGRRCFRAFVTVPFVLPTVVVATAFLALLRPGGPLAFSHWQRGVGADARRPRVLQRRGRRPHGRRVLGEPRPAARGGGARMLGAVAARAFRQVTLPLLAPVDRSPPRRSCSCSRSRRSVSRCCSPTRARDDRGRDLPAGGRVVRSPDRRRARASFRSSPCSRVLLVLAAVQERRAVAQRLVAARRHGPPAARPRARLVAGVLGATTLFLGGPLLVLACDRCTSAVTWSARRPTARSGRARRRARCSSRRGPRCATRSCSRPIATVIALVIGGLASVVIASRPGRAHPHDGRVADAAARNVGRHRRASASSSRSTSRRSISRRRGARAARARSGRDPVRRSARSCPRCAASTRACAMPRRCSARRRGGSGARSTCRSSARAFVVAAGFCAAVSLGEFGATLFVARPDSADGPDRDPAVPRTARATINVGQSLAMSR